MRPGRRPSEYRDPRRGPGHDLILVATPAAVGDNRIDLYSTDGRPPVNAKEAELWLGCPSRSIDRCGLLPCRSSPATSACAATCRSPGTGRGRSIC